MKSPYTARGPHKRPCDLCGTPILPGDLVEAWCWMGSEIGHGDIIRVHASCNDLKEEYQLEEWVLGEAFDKVGYEGHPSEQETALKALEAARARWRAAP